MICFFSHTGGHFDVTKEKRPMDMKKVSVDMCFSFNARTSPNSEALRRFYESLIAGRFEFSQTQCYLYIPALGCVYLRQSFFNEIEVYKRCSDMLSRWVNHRR